MIVLLASQSPRRRELLAQVGFGVRVRPADVDETPTSADPERAAREIAERKAAVASARQESDDCVFGLAADTVVWTDEGRMLGKPGDAADAADMLTALSGCWHRVTTAFTLFGESLLRTEHVTTSVRFAELSDCMIEQYIGSGEPFDKAGGYGIQGRAAAFVPEIRGSYANVVGLPVAEVCMAAADLRLLDRMPWVAP